MTVGGTSRSASCRSPRFRSRRSSGRCAAIASGKVVGYASYTIDDHWVDAPSREHRARRRARSGSTRKPRSGSGSTSRRSTGCARSAANDRSVDDPLHWQLVDGRALRAHDRSDFLWVRPLDVPALLSARRYPVERRVVLEVVDDMGYANGRFALDGGPDGATCTKASHPSRAHAVGFGPRCGVARWHVAGDARARRSGRRAQGRRRDAGRRALPLAAGALVQHLVLTPTPTLPP